MRTKIIATIGAALLFSMMAAHAAQPVLQRGYDAGVSGANLAETTLNTQFSKTTTCGTSVAVAATCTISVKFKPTTTGAMTAALEVNAGGGDGTQRVALSGTGT